MSILLIGISILTGLYLVTMLIVGRHVAYNDVLPRRRPRQEALVGYDHENVSFRSSDGVTLRGWFVKSGQNPSNRTLILLHGWFQTRGSLLSHIKFFVDNGFHVLAYDQRAHGESETALVTYGTGEAKDLLAAVAHLKQRTDVDGEKLGAIGFSLGTGGLIYGLASADTQLFKAVVLEGVFAVSYDVGKSMLQHRLGRVLGYVFGVLYFTVGSKVWSLGRFEHSRPVDLIGQIAPTPLLFIRGEKDRRAPAFSATRLMAAAPEPKQVWIHPGGHMSSYWRFPEEYGKRVLGFLNQHLSVEI